MTNHKAGLGQLVTSGVAIGAIAATIAILTSCGKSETPSIVATSANPPLAATTSPIPAASPSPIAIAPQTQSTPAPKTTPAPTSTLVAPDNNGDYGRSGHSRWVVTDPDPNGLNCRWSGAMPQAWMDPSAKLPRLNIQEWNVVRRFTKDTVLIANSTPAGFVTLGDEDRKYWLKVSIGANDQICLVRANIKFIKPIP